MSCVVGEGAVGCGEEEGGAAAAVVAVHRRWWSAVMLMEGGATIGVVPSIIRGDIFIRGCTGLDWIGL